MSRGSNQDAITRLAAVTLTNVLGDIYDFSSASRNPNSIAMITSIWITNTDTVGHFVTIRAGIAGALASPTPYSRGERLPLQPGQIMVIDSAGGGPIIILKQGDKLQGFADTTSVVNVAVEGALLAN